MRKRHCKKWAKKMLAQNGPAILREATKEIAREVYNHPKVAEIYSPEYLALELRELEDFIDQTATKE